MTITQIGGYELECHECGVSRIDVGFDLDMTYLWSNQYGTKLRLFCHRCGAVHDVLIRTSGYGYSLEIDRRSMRCAVFSQNEVGK